MFSRRSLFKLLSVAPFLPALRAASGPIPIGQIGTKHAHAAGKLATIRKFPELFDLVGVVEPDGDRIRQVSARSEYEGVSWISEAELLEREDVRAVAVETEVDQLVATALRCIKAGKHIHLDKPGGTSLPPFAALLVEAEKRSLTIQMGYMFRYNPAFQFLFRAVADGWLGPVREIHAVIGKKASPSLRQELAQYPGGGMFELGCHLIDALVTLMGPPGNVSPFHRQSHPDQDSFWDNQLTVFEFPGATATIRCNHVDPFGGPRRQFQVIGENGAIEIRPLEPPRLTLMIDQPRGDYPRGTHQVSLPKSTGRYDGEFQDLAAIIRGESTLAWNYEHDRCVQETVLRASGVPL